MEAFSLVGYALESAERVKDALELQERNSLHSAPMLAAKRAAFDHDGARVIQRGAEEVACPAVKDVVWVGVAVIDSELSSDPFTYSFAMVPS